MKKRTFEFLRHNGLLIYALYSFRITEYTAIIISLVLSSRCVAYVYTGKTLYSLEKSKYGRTSMARTLLEL